MLSGMFALKNVETWTLILQKNSLMKTCGDLIPLKSTSNMTEPVFCIGRQSVSEANAEGWV